MGNRLNIHAASPSGMPSPPLSPPIPTPAKTQLSESVPLPEKRSNNPGTFEELHKQCKDLLPQMFEGGKLMISKALSSHFQISHTLSMNAFQPSSYKFGATYVGSDQYGPQESYPILIGDIDASTNVNANIIHKFSQNTNTKFVTQIQNNKWVATQLSMDYRGENFTISGTVGNPDFLNKSGVFVAQYLQNVTSKLALGAELLCQIGQQIPGGEISVLSLASRYTSDRWTVSSNISPMAGGIHACYYHKINEQLQVGAEIETTVQMGESVATVAYQLEIPNASVSFRGQLDSNWCVGAVLEKKLQPLPFTLALSAYGNQVKSQYRFGIGLIVG